MDRYQFQVDYVSQEGNTVGTTLVYAQTAVEALETVGAEVLEHHEHDGSARGEKGSQQVFAAAKRSLSDPTLWLLAPLADHPHNSPRQIRFGCGHVETVEDAERWNHLAPQADGILDVRKRNDSYLNPFPTLCSECQKQREGHMLDTEIDPD